MRQYRGPNGEDRIWFEPSEIEKIMEAELRKAALMPTDEAPVVKLETFVERHVKAVLDQYADLDPTVLGVTEFFEGRQPRISLNKDLTGSALDEDESPPGVLGRWRATLAHEAGHVLLHRSLFEFAVGNMNLFDRNQAQVAGSRQLHRCLKRDVAHDGSGADWREVQANQAMAALLMPKSFFKKFARHHVGQLYPGKDVIPAGGEDRTAKVLAPLLQVSKQAARIRLSTCGFIPQPGQGRF
jgi:hypothetical protein